MRKLIGLAAALACISTVAFAQNCQTVDGQTYCDDPSGAGRVRSYAPSKESVPSDRIGSTPYYSDGTMAGRVGSLPYLGDGTPSSTIGGTTYLNDGRACSKVGNEFVCN